MGEASTIIDGNGALAGDRVLDIPGSATVTIQGVTLRGGQALSGGGIRNRGRLTVSQSTLTLNVAGLRISTGGGISNFGILTISNSSITRNRALGVGAYGGGLFNSPTGNLTIYHSTIFGNSATGSLNPGEAGGLVILGTASITRSTISGNRAGAGGGIKNSGTLSISFSTIFGNSATGSSGDGGGIQNEHGLTITDSTIAGNWAEQNGGGITHNLGPRMQLNNVTITQNATDGAGGGIGEIPTSSGDVALVNTILAENIAATAPDCSISLVSFGYNLLGNNSGCDFTSAEGDQIGTPRDPIDPLLAALANNGGSTWTHSLLVGSPAIDAGNPAGCTDDEGNLLLTDQRGFDRHVDGDGNGSEICDIGAYEKQ